MFWCVAACAAAMSVMFDLVVKVMEAIAAKSRYGTLPWYVEVAKEFQYGDALVLQDLQYVYNPVNTANRVVALAAAKEAPGIVNLKIARIVSGANQPLTTAQYNDFVFYIAKKKPAGVNVNIINDVADDLRLFVDVNYDPLVLSPTGELIGSPGTYPVEDKINEYLKSLDFDGRFEISDVEDFIEAGTGVIKGYVTNAEARYGTNPFVSFPKRYYPNAGHLVIYSGTPLNTSITYIANV
jgi:hypothetical protein